MASYHTKEVHATLNFSDKSGPMIWLSVCRFRFILSPPAPCRAVRLSFYLAQIPGGQLNVSYRTAGSGW
jgi:hypothetical protein